MVSRELPSARSPGGPLEALSLLRLPLERRLGQTALAPPLRDLQRTGPWPHQSPPNCPPRSDSRSGARLLHHSNCSVVCVHQGSRRDSQLNPNMQFSPDTRPIGRQSAEARLPFGGKNLLLQWCRMSLPSFHAAHLSPGTQAAWAAGQLLLNVTEGAAESQRRSYPRGHGARADSDLSVLGNCACQGVSRAHPARTNEPMLSGKGVGTSF